MNQPVIDSAIAYIQALFAGNADGHDADHSLRVYHNALRIIASYPEVDAELVALASLLHDADDHKLFHTENYANARSFLQNAQLDALKTERIIDAIASVSFSKNREKRPGTLEGMIVQDADRLDAIGAIGIARTFAFGGKHDRTLASSVDHFHEKLLLLKDLMNTSAARELAEHRHAVMVQFLEELKTEGLSQN